MAERHNGRPGRQEGPVLILWMTGAKGSFWAGWGLGLTLTHVSGLAQGPLAKTRVPGRWPSDSAFCWLVQGFWC